MIVYIYMKDNHGELDTLNSMIIYIYMKDNHGELDTLNYDRIYIYDTQSRRSRHPQL